MFIIDENVQCLIRYENIFDKDKSGTFYNLLELSITGRECFPEFIQYICILILIFKGHKLYFALFSVVWMKICDLILLGDGINGAHI